MGEHKVNRIKSDRAVFIEHLLNDVKALELMLEKGMIENDVVRIGAEQEFCLVNNDWRPSKKAIEILNDINDPHFTTELALYNLEINLDPLVLEGGCFQRMKSQLESLLYKARTTAEKHGAKIILTGILATISKDELHKSFMTPSPRYDALNDIMREFRGSDFSLHLKGVDELSVKHKSVLFEACNTSFQLHLQIDPEDFLKSYNWAQAISGPVLGICCNSPLLMGRELWHETRIALFQQSLDTRSSSYSLKDQQPRVAFGTKWAKGTAAAVFKEDISLHEVALSKQITTNSINEVLKGSVPELEALKLHNGTVYRWNRPCYGVGGGKPHLRIENRYIPSGPSITDEIANFAFWVGLMKGRPEHYGNISEIMNFREAKANFIKAARTGKESIMRWNGKELSVSELIMNELLPIAEDGLVKMNIEEDDITSFLGVIHSRVKGKTGARWQIDSFRKLRKEMKVDDALVSLTKSTYQNQTKDNTVANWPYLEPNRINSATLVRHIMSTALFTVHKEDLSDLASSIMSWRNIHHMPVISRDGELIGLLTDSYMKETIQKSKDNECTTVEDVMIKKVFHVSPITTIEEATRLMNEHKFGCLPVVSNNHLVGIVSKKDLGIEEYG